MLASFVVALVAALGVNAAIGPVADLPIVNKEIAPDGFNRPTVLAGGTFPGPLITGNKGAQFKINVQDRLTDDRMRKSTSIHWHGFFQKGSNWADGGAFVNQCPIAPGNDFEYRFKSEKQAGTFWYHSHLSTQYCDGLRGAMVVRDPLDINQLLYDVDNENTVITLADWYHTVAPQQKLPATPDSTLINGKGRYPGGPSVPLSVIKVKKGKRYRFRIVSLSCDPSFTFSIDGHDMTIIAIDSINVLPKTVDQIQVFSGQRYDVVVKANKPIGNYHVRANPNLGPQGFNDGVNSAILRYDGAPDAEPAFSAGTATKPLVEKDLKPQNIFTWPAPGLPKVDGADVNINLNLAFAIINGTFLFTVNGKSFKPPTVPVLLQILSGAQDPNSLLPEGLVIPLPRGKSVQVSMPANVIGGIGGPHPFHMHGHAFHVVRAAGQSDYNWFNPPQRDVVSGGLPGDNVTIRFRTDNPGPWFLHCHIDWHLEEGLALVFAEDVGSTRNQDPPPAWDALCPTYDALDPKDQ